MRRYLKIQGKQEIAKVMFDDTAKNGKRIFMILSRRAIRMLFPYFLIIPAIVTILLIVIYPLAYSLGLSFFYYNPAQSLKANFIGLRNYVSIFTDELFMSALKITLIFAGAAVILELLAGLGIALLLTRRLKGTMFLRSLIVVPTVLAPVVVGLMWRYLYFSEGGLVSELFKSVGWLEKGVLAYPSTALFALIVSDVWEWTGFMALILFAGLESIPRQLYEVASIDGGSTWQIFRYVTLPILKPVVVVAVLFRVMDALKAFDKIYATTRGGPGTSTFTLSFYIWQEGLRFFEIGYAAALTWIMLIIIITLCQVYIKISYKEGI